MLFAILKFTNRTVRTVSSHWGGSIQSPVRFRIRQLAPYVSARTMSSLVVAECCEGGWWFVNLILAWERLRAVGVVVTDL